MLFGPRIMEWLSHSLNFTEANEDISDNVKYSCTLFKSYLEFFLIIDFVMHYADIPFNLDYNSYQLLRTDSTLFFNTSLFWRKSHCDLFFGRFEHLLFLQNTWINQHVVSRFLSNREKVFAKCRVRTIPIDRTSLWGAIYRNFEKRKTVRISCCDI